ncbi:hypothetical protein [Caedibacter taeniospiralis]|uniref:Lipoprotein n=1 Tax=Caedibacter taeniospiralis TaxID=28907 RepID=Q6TFF0_CAETA|nr:hypothetical protein [Caedibacter taeniospiralis]AAR87109.1 hypothetical protein [Caedibacter taeniospiralis]
MKKYSKVLTVLSLSIILGGCTIGPLVEIKLAEEGAKFVEKEVQIIEKDIEHTDENNHA